jgi:hypothetical protein
LPPAYPAKENDRQNDDRAVPVLKKFISAAQDEVTRRGMHAFEIDMCDSGTSGADVDIANTYLRKLAGLRYLPKRERPNARRAAREWYIAALKALQEKRTVERRASRRLSKLELNTVSPG